jgi:hypothetical protein
MASEVQIPILEYTVKTRNSRTRDPVMSLNVADAILDAAITSLFNAIDGVCIGSLVKSTLVTRTDKDAGTSTRPASSAAQKEVRFKVFFTDDTNSKKGSFEIPCADLSLLSGGSDVLDITAGAGLTLVTQVEANVLSIDGNAITVDRVELYTRN